MMQLLSDLLPDPTTIDMLIEESMPRFIGWLLAIVLIVIAMAIFKAVSVVVKPSPVEKLVRRRGFGV